MTATALIRKYINNVESGVPIYTSNVFEYVHNNIPAIDKATFNVYLARYQKDNPELIRYKKGIYYRKIDTPFGFSPIDEYKVFEDTYLKSSDDIIGYETGPSLINMLGLSTQMPTRRYYATNKVRYSQNYTNNIYLVKPRILVNKNNYKYLQLLDVLENKYHANIDAINPIKILKTFVIHNKLKLNVLLKYAKEYKSIDIYNAIVDIF